MYSEEHVEILRYLWCRRYKLDLQTKTVSDTFMANTVTCVAVLWLYSLSLLVLRHHILYAMPATWVNGRLVWFKWTYYKGHICTAAPTRPSLASAYGIFVCFCCCFLRFLLFYFFIFIYLLLLWFCSFCFVVIIVFCFLY